MGPRLEMNEWMKRLDMLLGVALGRTASSFEGVMWEKLYHAGISSGMAFEAFLEEYRAVELEDAEIFKGF